jgi:valyl-tRNA synthetase
VNRDFLVRAFVPQEIRRADGLLVLEERSFDVVRSRVLTTTTVVDGVEVVTPLGGLIDAQKETKRLQQQVEEKTSYIARTQARLNDPQFTGKAPPEVVEQTRSQLAQAQETLKKLSEYLAVLQSM